mmetsp:Transcript_44109/g.64827  ORF Transcript_44109/g.64827 Transcript_44109/m.64827 type:complete len:528 (+) Transcript_44109:288-1871(+)
MTPTPHDTTRISSLSTDNPTPHLIPEGDNATPLDYGSSATDKLVLIIVGLPACGKTHVAQRIVRYLNFFLDVPSEIFNAGDYRREMVGAQVPASFYDPNNEKALRQLTEVRNAALEDMVQFLKLDGVRVAVYDAPNATTDKREMISNRLKQERIGAKQIFLECICDDEEILKKNIRKYLDSAPDYRDCDPDAAFKDFKERRERYMSDYETVHDEEGSYVKVYDCKRFVLNNIRGYLPLKICHFVMNLHTLPRTFYLSRHGQSEYNVLGKIGGDSGLSKAGLEYARRLADYARDVITVKTNTLANDYNGTTTEKEITNEDIPARLWTSTLRRTKETAQFIKHPSITHPGNKQTDDQDEVRDWVQLRPLPRRNLDELYAGTCDGMTYKEIEQVYPEEFARRQSDKLSYRYPRGESYMDVILRLEPLAHEMERTREPILMIGHQGILRILYAYFMGLSRDEAPYVSIPLNTVIKLEPHAYGCKEERICLMNKKEMLNDGQDEPVTSMPRLVVDKGENYAQDDPVMNAPSC